MNKQEPITQGYFVIEGPNMICNQFGIKAFIVPKGRYVVAKLDYNAANKPDIIAVINTRYKDKLDAEKMARTLTVTKPNIK